MTTLDLESRDFHRSNFDDLQNSFCTWLNSMKNQLKTFFPFLGLLFFYLNCSSAPLVIIETVNVGSPKNLADPRTGLGSVPHLYAIGKYEVTINQYIQFLNSVATIYNPAKPWISNLYHTEMSGYKKIGALILRTGEGTPASPYAYTNPEGGDGNRPVPWVNWFDCARFANWMHNGAGFGADTERGAYNLNGRSKGFVRKQPKAQWWIPNENEWYKAAFYDPVGDTYSYWPTQSMKNIPLPCGDGLSIAPNSANYNYCGTSASNKTDIGGLLTPVGSYTNSPSFFGTYDQAGNLWEWTDTKTAPSMRVIRGGSWSNGILTIDVYQRRDYPYEELRGIHAYADDDTGFRLASVFREPLNK